MPRNSGAHLQVGSVLNDEGRHAEAIEPLEKALELGTVLKASAANRMTQEIRRQLRIARDDREI
eukprot:SAG31_NODE_9816_length_1223_cov_3.743772_2_plen_64_part_00